MSYFPILKAPGCVGQTTLCNYPPNNWEDLSKGARLIHVTWAQGGVWHSEVIGELPFGATQSINENDVASIVPSNALALLSLDKVPLPASSAELPVSASNSTTPNYRASIGLMSLRAFTSYQGELDPFPVPGSLLTFAPFIQFGSEIENYVLLLNLERNPQARASTVEIYDSAKPGSLRASFEANNNNVSAIRLDCHGFGREDLPVIICKGMSSIPLYFSKSEDGACLSLEHTHPPASYVIHGKRWEAQKMLKNDWFAKLGKL